MKTPNTPTPMMKCGHAANAHDKDGKPCCVICFGIAEADIVVPTPDLTGRLAKCAECTNTVPSNMELAFFEHHPDREKDTYYCGCHGWN